MARLCEEGSLAQPTLVVGNTVFEGSSIEQVKIGVSVALQEVVGASDNLLRIEGLGLDSLVPFADAARVTQDAQAISSAAPYSDSVGITNS